MRCATARRWLSSRLDHELSPARDARLENHLAGCSKCRSFAVGIRADDEALNLLEVPSTHDLSERVISSLAVAPPVEMGWMSRLLGPHAARAAIALIGFGLGAWMSRGIDPPFFASAPAEPSRVSV